MSQSTQYFTRNGTTTTILSRMFFSACLSALAPLSVNAKDPAGGVEPSQVSSHESKTQVVGVWQPPTSLKQVSIWPRSAPDSAGIAQPAESVLTRITPEALEGNTSQTVFDVSSPTMTVSPPRGNNTGAAVIVFPGGGFRMAAITLDGSEICNWITSKGMPRVVSKYRVPGTNHYWNSECKCHITPEVPQALQDAQRTIRLVRAKAKELQINRRKIGVMGFSAGGYLGAQMSNIFKAGDAIGR